MRVPYRLPLYLGALLVALAGSPAAIAADELSPAEQRVFMDDHLKNLPPSAVLRYVYHKDEAGQGAVDDEVVLTTHDDAGRGRVAEVDYGHGDRHLALPSVDHATGNPVILYFLEADVRDMHKRLGGMENYFRRRIRLALADSAATRPVRFAYGGKTVDGVEVAVEPYKDDPMKDRFKGMDGKRYTFTLSDAVPGGVYQLRTRVDGAKGSPTVEETLTFKGVKP